MTFYLPNYNLILRIFMQKMACAVLFFMFYNFTYTAMQQRRTLAHIVQLYPETLQVFGSSIQAYNVSSAVR